MKPVGEPLGPGRVPPPPPAAAGAFGEHLPAATAYAALLAEQGVPRGLLGPREVPRLWDRHLLNCVVVAPLLPRATDVCDVGSGAGLPGLVLAIVRPDLRLTLLEPLQRRALFLAEAVDRLHLDNVRVVRARAEDWAGQAAYDVAVARAVAPLNRLAGWALPLVVPGGELLALKGRSAVEELEQAAADLERQGAQDWRVVEVGRGTVEPPTTVVRIRRGRAAQERLAQGRSTARVSPVRARARQRGGRR